MNFGDNNRPSRLTDFFEELILEGLKKRFKEEEKKDGKSTPKAKAYNAMEVCGWVMIMALPIGIGQLYLLGQLKNALLSLH